MLQQKLPGIKSSEDNEKDEGAAAASPAVRGFIDQYFGKGRFTLWY